MNENGPVRPKRLMFGSTDATPEFTIEAHYNPPDIEVQYRTNRVDEGAVNGAVAPVNPDLAQISATTSSTRGRTRAR